MLDFADIANADPNMVAEYLSAVDFHMNVEGSLSHFEQDTVPELTENNRYGFETIAAQTETPNDQGFRFTAQSMPGVVAGYKLGKPLMVNHVKYGQNLGYGETLDAHYDETNLIVLSYISRGKTTPNGPFGSSDELIDGINDGFVKYASASGYVRESKCSICKKDGPQSPFAWLFGFSSDDPDEDKCRHIRNREYEVDNNAGGKEKQKAIAEIMVFDAVELSIAWSGSDDKARIVTRDVAIPQFTRNELILGSQLPQEHLLSFSRNWAGFTPDPQPTDPKSKGDDYKMSIETLTAEKKALEAQVSAKDVEIASLKATNTALEAQVTEKDTEIAELKQTQTENEKVIKDGEFAREKAIDNCVEAFVRTEPDTTEAELNAKKDAEKAAIETFTLEQIDARTNGYNSFADKMYPDGRSTNDSSSNDNSESTNKRTRKTKGGRLV